MLGRDPVDGGFVSARRRLFDRQETTESNYSGISCNSGTTEDLILTVSRAPLSYRSGRRRGSLEGVENRLLETALCFDSEVDLEDKRMLDAHNIDTPSWLQPLGSNLTDARYNGHSDILPDSRSSDGIMDPEMASCHPFSGGAGGGDTSDLPGGRFSQARRYVGRRLGHGHHKRHPSPIRRREKDKEDVDGKESPPITVNVSSNASYPENFYPIFLPMDQAFKAKYVFSNKKGKTCKEKIYLFLEHPCGWCCFFYHFVV